MPSLKDILSVFTKSSLAEISAVTNGVCDTQQAKPATAQAARSSLPTDEEIIVEL